jgi:hypothetical protein
MILAPETARFLTGSLRIFERTAGIDWFWDELVTKKESPIARMRAPLSAATDVPETVKIRANALRKCITSK